MYYKELSGPKGPDELLEAYELRGKDVKKVIARIEIEKTDEKDKKTGKWKYITKMFFVGKDGKVSGRWYDCPKSVRFGLNLTISGETEDWIGKEVTLYPTQCYAFGDIKPCIRIRVTDEIRKKIVIFMKTKGVSERMYEVILNK